MDNAHETAARRSGTTCGGTGSGYESVSAASVTVTVNVVDDDTAGADAVADGRWRWTEGASGSYTVALNDGPRRLDVTVWR